MASYHRSTLFKHTENIFRSLSLGYVQETSVRDIGTYRFQALPSTFDTTLPGNAGFRYDNIEHINYFPDWPGCPNVTAPPQQSCANVSIDCAIPDNYCNQCCHGSYINGTYLLPPGMFPLKCFPGSITVFGFFSLLTFSSYAFWMHNCIVLCVTKDHSSI